MRSPELAPNLSEEIIDPHEVERSELFDRLERRANTVIELKKKLSEAEPAMPAEEFNTLMDTEFQQIVDSFPETSQREFQRAMGFQKKMAGLDRQHDTEQFRSEVVNILQSMMKTFQSDEDARLLYNLHQSVGSWKRKHAVISYLVQHPESVPDAVQLMLKGREIDPQYIKDTKFDSTHMALTLDPEYYDQFTMSPSTDGVHYSHSPLSVIRDQAEAGRQMVIDHEAMHNLLDGAPNVQVHNRGELLELFSSAIQDQPEAETVIEREHILNLSANEVLDEFHHELLAGLDEVEQNVFPNISTAELGNGWMEQYMHYASNFSTAGFDARKMVNELFVFVDNHPDSDIGHAARKLGVSFAKRFAETVETMRVAVDRAREIGPQANEQVHSLFMILPPSKYRHIPRFLDQQYGEQKG